MSKIWVSALGLVALATILHHAEAVPMCCLAFGRPPVTLGNMKACKDICDRYMKAIHGVKDERKPGESDHDLFIRIGKERFLESGRRRTTKMPDDEEVTIFDQVTSRPVTKPSSETKKKLKQCERKLAKAKKKIKSLEKQLTKEENDDDD